MVLICIFIIKTKNEHFPIYILFDKLYAQIYCSFIDWVIC